MLWGKTRKSINTEQKSKKARSVSRHLTSKLSQIVPKFSSKTRPSVPVGFLGCLLGWPAIVGLRCAVNCGFLTHARARTRSRKQGPRSVIFFMVGPLRQRESASLLLQTILIGCVFFGMRTTLGRVILTVIFGQQIFLSRFLCNANNFRPTLETARNRKRSKLAFLQG